MPAVLDAALVLAWARASVAVLERHRVEVDRINVFPVADADTGTNLLLTMGSALASAEAAADGAAGGQEADVGGIVAALARGALLGARGNSGVILSQVLRGFAEGVAEAPRAVEEDAAAVFAAALARGNALATAALADPRQGTALTVLAAAGAAASAVGAAAVGAAASAVGAAAPAVGAAASGDPALGAAAADIARAGAGVGVGVAVGGGGGGAAVDAAADAAVNAAADAAALKAAADGGDPPLAPALARPLSPPDPTAAAGGRGGLARAASAAADAAAEALRATTAQMPALSRAGVVDAGGMGIYLLLDAFAGLLADRPPTAAPLPCARDKAALTTTRESGSSAYDYEVMYLLDAAAPAVDGMRARLDELGDSVAVVGDGGDLWHVHLHCNDIGAAVEAGFAAGRAHRITVIRFADQLAPDPFVRPRAVLMVVAGEEIARLARASGAVVVAREPNRTVTEDALVAGLAATSARQVVLMPGDPDLVATAEAAAATARRDGQDVLVLPTASVLQSLSALAVHDPTRRSGEDVVAMADAAAGTRTAALLVAETEALTWVGRCEPGDVLGIADGEVVLIAPDLSVGALWLAHRMLLVGGEIVTALLGAGADAALAEGLAANLRRTHPEVDVVVHHGGQSEYPLVLGVE